MSTSVTKMARENGWRKIDAKAPLALEVKPVDIAKSDKKSPGNCAFACAAKRQQAVDAAYFFRSTAWLRRGKTLTRYILPQSVQKEIVAFDRNKTMEPGLYELKRPCKSETMAAISKRGKKRPGRHMPGKTKIKRGIVHRTTGVRGLLV